MNRIDAQRFVKTANAALDAAVGVAGSWIFTGLKAGAILFFGLYVVAFTFDPRVPYWWRLVIGASAMVTAVGVVATFVAAWRGAQKSDQSESAAEGGTVTAYIFLVVAPIVLVWLVDEVHHRIDPNQPTFSNALLVGTKQWIDALFSGKFL